MEKFKGALLVGALRLFALLPWRAVQAVGSAIGWIMWKTPNRSRDTVRINLSKCFPDMDPAERERLVGRSLMDIGKSLTESACAWIWPAQRSIDLVREVEGLEVLHEALASGKGVVGITSHLGNWEVLNHFYCSQCKPIIFYRPPKLKAVDDLLRKQRVQLDQPLPLPSYEMVLKASHTFNLLDARRAISVTARQQYILRVRTLARSVAQAYLLARAKLGFPMATPDLRDEVLAKLEAAQ